MEILIIILAMFFSIYISILGFLLVKKKQQHERLFYEMWKKKLKKNKKLRENRGGWKVYYDKEKNTESIKEHRNYKRDLYLKNKI